MKTELSPLLLVIWEDMNSFFSYFINNVDGVDIEVNKEMLF